MSTGNLSLLTDLYELTMMQGYFVSGNRDRVVFDLFYRKNPCDGGYAIMAGLEQVIDYIKELHFDDEDVAYLRSLHIFSEEFLSYLSTFRFSGDIFAIPEGTVIFPNEPLVKVIAPIMEAQLIETALLNIINHQSLIATKASRVVYAAKGDGIMEFGARRAQGPDSSIYGARAAMIGGCVGTRNIMVPPRRIPIIFKLRGTMSRIAQTVPKYIASPPKRGIGLECILLLSLGMSIAPSFGASFIQIGVITQEIIRAMRSINMRSRIFRYFLPSVSFQQRNQDRFR